MDAPNPNSNQAAMPHRVRQSLKNLLAQRQFYLLLVLLLPLMFSLHWIAVRFPIYDEYSSGPTIHEVEPEKLAVIFEGTRSGGRAWLLNLEQETLELIECPPEIGKEWPFPIGIDANSNLIFAIPTSLFSYVGWNARTGTSYVVALSNGQPILINSRYLACFTNGEHGCEFVWCDLDTPKLPHRRMPIMKMPIHDTRILVTPIAGTDSFYFVLPAEDRYWLDTGIGMEAEITAPNDYSYELYEWTKPDGSIEYELPPVVVNPNAPEPCATVVLMNLREQGPKEIARWSVLNDYPGSEVTAVPGYVICQSLDACFFETRDARSGEIVARVPIPTSALTGTTFLRWNFLGSIVHFCDRVGLDIAFECKTGMQLASSTPLGTLGYEWRDQRNNEYLAWRTKSWRDWPGEMQVRSVATDEVLHAWKLPDHHVSAHDGSVHFSADGRNVLFFTDDLRAFFVDKVTGKVVRHIQPRFWLLPLGVVLGLTTLVWFICWIRISVRSGVSLWVDELVLLVVVSVFLYWRINLSARLEFDQQRLAWASVAAMSIAALTLVVNQTLFRNVRLRYRCGPIIMLTAGAIYGQWMGRHLQRADDTLLELLLVALLILCSIMVHFLFFRKPRLARVAPVTVRRRFALREIFAWTALVAVMLALLQRHDAVDWIRGLTWDGIAEMLCVGCTIVAVTLSAYYLTAERCYLVFRLTGGCFVAVLFTISAAYRLDWIDLNAYLFSTIPFYVVASTCERLSAIAVGSMLMALPIGMRNGVGSGDVEVK